MITPKRQAISWGLRPRAYAWPGEFEGMSVAVFGGREANKLTLSAPPDSETHVLTVSASSHRVLMEVDGKVIKNGHSHPGLAMLLRSGQQPALEVNGTWEVVQFYLPDRLVREVSSDLLLPQNLIDDLQGPQFAPDEQLLRLSSSITTRLLSEDPPTRLEMDELGLDVIEHLLTRYSPHPRLRAQSLAGPDSNMHLADVIESCGETGVYGACEAYAGSLAEVHALLKRNRSGPK